MKATGIVRRIEACVIKGKPPKTRINTGFFASLPYYNTNPPKFQQVCP